MFLALRNYIHAPPLFFPLLPPTHVFFPRWPWRHQPTTRGSDSKGGREVSVWAAQIQPKINFPSSLVRCSSPSSDPTPPLGIRRRTR